ncbi:hypothetical protein [Methylobacterium tarhaniae]|uniref:hypothetical protein n=1 Tax=Methylobacterium tarhaniae TaxID=1187852 RepID=UPI003D028F1F
MPKVLMAKVLAAKVPLAEIPAEYLTADPKNAGPKRGSPFEAKISGGFEAGNDFVRWRTSGAGSSARTSDEC